MKGRWICVFIFFALCVFSQGISPLEARGETLVIAAAANLQRVFTELGAAFQEKTGIRVASSFASTGELTHQIKSGFPYDLFAPAGLKALDELKEDFLIAESITVFGKGKLAMVTLKDNNLNIKDLSELRNARLNVVIANPEHAPYGKAAEEALDRMGLWQGNLEYRAIKAPNVLEAARYLEGGRAEVGILPLSIIDPTKFDSVLVDESLYNPVEQGVAIIKTSKKQKTAQGFIDLLKSEEGKAILKKYGF